MPALLMQWLISALVVAAPAIAHDAPNGARAVASPPGRDSTEWQTTSVGHGITLVSISVDPEHDTPKALRDYAATFGARDGWLFLTGRKSDVDDVLRRFAQWTPTRETHTALFVLGNVTTGHWIKVHPDASPADIAQRLESLAAETGHDGDGSRP